MADGTFLDDMLFDEDTVPTISEDIFHDVLLPEPEPEPVSQQTSTKKRKRQGGTGNQRKKNKKTDTGKPLPYRKHGKPYEWAKKLSTQEKASFNRRHTVALAQLYISAPPNWNYSKYTISEQDLYVSVANSRWNNK